MTMTKIFVLIDKNGKNVPVVAPEGTKFPSRYIKDFEPWCGAGRGFGNTLVSETIWGLPVSPACYIHDLMWEEAEPTWEAFHASNSIFIRNLISLIVVQSKMSFLKSLRMHGAVAYYNAVDTFGKDIFWSLKRRQANGAIYNDGGCARDW